MNSLINGEVQTGIATGINDSGHLIVEVGNDSYTLSSTKKHCF